MKRTVLGIIFSFLHPVASHGASITGAPEDFLTTGEPGSFLDSPISESGNTGFEGEDEEEEEELLQPGSGQDADSVAMETQNQSTGDIVVIDELEGGGGGRGRASGSLRKEKVSLPPRTISVTSDDLLGVDDFEHFEVLDTTGEIDPPPSHLLPGHHPHKDDDGHHSITGVWVCLSVVQSHWNVSVKCLRRWQNVK